MSNSGLPSTTKLVAYALWDFSDQRGRNIHPGISKLAAIVGVSNRTIERALKQLRQEGWIVRTKSHQDFGKRSKMSDVYALGGTKLSTSGRHSDVAPNELWGRQAESIGATNSGFRHDTQMSHQQIIHHQSDHLTRGTQTGPQPHRPNNQQLGHPTVTTSADWSDSPRVLRVYPASTCIGAMNDEFSDQ